MSKNTGSSATGRSAAFVVDGSLSAIDKKIIYISVVVKKKTDSFVQSLGAEDDDGTARQWTGRKHPDDHVLEPPGKRERERPSAISMASSGSITVWTRLV